jgi:hypothetical protein
VGIETFHNKISREKYTILQTIAAYNAYLFSEKYLLHNCVGGIMVSKLCTHLTLFNKKMSYRDMPKFYMSKYCQELKFWKLPNYDAQISALD